ncbi:MAG: hypothetical protein K2X38_16085 [Gemmataceae bacterium]|nr:hypothetical protein [Gemmataceae bacterium]
MDALASLLLDLKRRGIGSDNMLGLLHIAIGRTVRRTKDNVVLSRGMAWRELSTLLKKIRWDPNSVASLGIDPESLPPRDRQKFWYAAISRTPIDSQLARESAEKLTVALRELGYEVGPAPGSSA